VLTELTKSSLKTNTDKSFWHKYTEAYDSVFAAVRAKNPKPMILEFGVFKGESIQTYLDFFPNSEIYGVDILPVRPGWPKASNVTYHEVDQGKRAQVKNLLLQLDKKFDLAIEDGGHRPDQQFNSLVETLPYMKPGSVYILEDLHTSMKGHPLNRYFRLFGERYRGNCYTLLLAIKHLQEQQELGKISAIDAEKLLTSKFQESALMTRAEVAYINSRIDSIQIYKRADLPLACWQCHSENFDFMKLRCADCGKDLIGIQESLTAILNIR
jgi:hypothetical protein